jgi:iduronate 2-sulfatase
VIRELDRLGLREETIIVFWSDHGFHLGEHGLWCKTSNFELDARVPMMISAPGIGTPGTRSDSLVELLDLYPTLAELCGLKPPEGLEGTSLVPILRDPNAEVKQASMTQHTRPAYPPSGSDPELMGYSIRTSRFRYTEWRNFVTGIVEAAELYDHELDPAETINLASDEDQSSIVQQHAAILAAMLVDQSEAVSIR